MNEHKEVEFVAWNMASQMAIDKDDNVWRVGGWHTTNPNHADTINGDLIRYEYDEPEFADQWERVDFVSLYCSLNGQRKWATINPDDFDRPTEG